MSNLKSINRVQVVGTLKEMNLEKITKEVSFGEKKITCEQFAKKEFKNPMFIVEVNLVIILYIFCFCKEL